jgi:hypothetical protein
MLSRKAIDVLGLDELEEADISGVVLMMSERLGATQVSGMVEAEPESGARWRAPHDEALERRAFRLLKDERVRSCVREITKGADRGVRGGWAVAVIVVLALALGFLTNEVGHGKVINLLSIPLLGLVLWNLCVYAAVLGAMARGRKPGEAGRSRMGWLNRWLMRGVGVQLPVETEAAPATEGAKAVVAVARAAFWRKWVEVLRAKAASWTEITFHAGAIALATGLVGGMYARGLSAEYKAAWESTFLREPAVTRILQIALGPAALVLGERIPAGREMQALNIHDQETIKPNQRESAAKWIHLYALTAVLFIGLPRLLLLGLALRGLRQVDRRVPLEPTLRMIFEKLVRQVTGRESTVMVLPFAHDLTPERQTALRVLVRRLWPETGSLLFRPVVAYGEEDEALDLLEWPPVVAGKKPASRPAVRLVVVMSLSATPENEVHGHLLRELGARTPPVVREEDGGLAVILDTTAFHAQFDSLPEVDRRVRERRAIWERVIDGALETAFSEDEGFYVWRQIGRKRS